MRTFTLKLRTVSELKILDLCTFHSISVNKQNKDKTNRTEDKNGVKLIQI